MQFYMPRIGDQIKLIKDWSFKNQQEYRNSDFLDKYWEYSEHYQFDEDDIFASLAPEKLDLKSGEKMDIIIPRGTVLKFSRVYIRQGASSGWDSVTFSLVSCPIEKLSKGRFWVKVHDANKIQFEKVGSKELLAPTISLNHLSTYDDKKGAHKRLYSGNSELQRLEENPITEETFKININEQENYFHGIVRKEYTINIVEEVKSIMRRNKPGYVDVYVTKINFSILKDSVEVGKATSISGLRKKVKELFIADNS